MTVTRGSVTGSDTTFTVAAKDTPISIRLTADYICGGSGSNRIDQLQISQAVSEHEDVTILPGNFYVSDSVIMGTTPGVGDRKTLRFQEGSKLNGQGVSLNKPLIQINSSSCQVHNFYGEGGGIQGNGIGIKIGADDLPQPNNVQIFNPEFINGNVGVMFNCQLSGGTESTGDCTIWGGRMRQLQVGVKSKGFVNRVDSLFISYCDYGVQQTTDRDSGRIDLQNCTINQWRIAALDFQRGRGHSVHNLWAERTDNSLAPVEVIRLGSAGQTVRDVNFTGTIHLHCGSSGTIEQYVLHLIRCRGLRMDSLEITNELPSVAIVRIDDSSNNGDNWIGKIMIGDVAPVGWTYDKLLSNPNNAFIAIDAFPGPAGSEPGEVIGNDWRANPNFTYTIFRFPGTDQYLAKNRANEWVKVAADFVDGGTSTYISGFHDVLTATVGQGVSYFFDGPQFEFVEDPAGNNDHVAFSGWHGLEFCGRGAVSTVIANWRDDSIGGYDTLPDVEPFSFTRCANMKMHDLEIFAGGNQDANNSSDTIDMDGSSRAHIWNTRVRRSRARALAFDGGDTGSFSGIAHFHDNEFYGTPKRPMVSTSAVAGTTTLQEYRYCMTFVDTLYGESPPGDYTKFVPTSAIKKMRLQFESTPTYKGTKGITLQRIYRWSAAQPTYRRIAEVPFGDIVYEDGATDASIAAAATPPTTGVPTVPKEGIKILGSDRNVVEDNYIAGTGSHNIQIVRKGSDAATNKNANGNIITHNILRYAGLGTALASCAGVFAGGADLTKISENDIANPGNDAARGYGIYIQNQDGGTAVGTQFDGNTIYDDRDANHPHLLKGMLSGIRQFVAGAAVAADHTAWGFNRITGSISVAINDGGTNSHTPSEVGHFHTGPGQTPISLPLFYSGEFIGNRMHYPYSSLTPVQMTANHITGADIYVVNDITLTQMAFQITTIATVGTKARIVIYAASDTDGLWNGSPIYESGDIATNATTGVKSVTGLSIALPGQKRYFFCLVSDGDMFVNGFQPTVSYRGFTALLGTGKLNGLDKAIGTAWQASSVGAAPAAPVNTNNIPAVDGLLA